MSSHPGVPRVLLAVLAGALIASLGNGSTVDTRKARAKVALLGKAGLEQQARTLRNAMRAQELDVARMNAYMEIYAKTTPPAASTTPAASTASAAAKPGFCEGYTATAGNDNWDAKQCNEKLDGKWVAHNGLQAPMGKCVDAPAKNWCKATCRQRCQDVAPTVPTLAAESPQITAERKAEAAASNVTASNGTLSNGTALAVAGAVAAAEPPLTNVTVQGNDTEVKPPPPTQHSYAMDSDFFLAAGGESCLMACTEKGMVCNTVKIADAGSSGAKCKSLLQALASDLPAMPAERNDTNSGCTFSPLRGGEFFLFSLPGADLCSAAPLDKKQQRACACGRAPANATTGNTTAINTTTPLFRPTALPAVNEPGPVRNHSVGPPIVPPVNLTVVGMPVVTQVATTSPTTVSAGPAPNATTTTTSNSSLPSTSSAASGSISTSGSGSGSMATGPAANPLAQSPSEANMPNTIVADAGSKVVLGDSTGAPGPAGGPAGPAPTRDKDGLRIAPPSAGATGSESSEAAGATGATGAIGGLGATGGFTPPVAPQGTKGLMDTLASPSPVSPGTGLAALAKPTAAPPPPASPPVTTSTSSNTRNSSTDANSLFQALVAARPLAPLNGSLNASSNVTNGSSPAPQPVPQPESHSLANQTCCLTTSQCGASYCMTVEAQGKVGVLQPPPVEGCPSDKPYVCHTEKPNDLDSKARREKYGLCVRGCPLAYCLKVCATAKHNCSDICVKNLPANTDLECQNKCGDAINNSTEWQSVDIEAIAEQFKHVALEHSKNAKLEAHRRAAGLAKSSLLKNPKAPPMMEAYDDGRCHSIFLVNSTCPALHGCLKLGSSMCRAASALHDTEWEKLNIPKTKDTVYSIKMSSVFRQYTKTTFPTSLYDKVLAEQLKVDVADVETSLSDLDETGGAGAASGATAMSAARRRLLSVQAAGTVARTGGAGVVVTSDVTVKENGVVKEAAVQAKMKSIKRDPSSFASTLTQGGVEKAEGMRVTEVTVTRSQPTQPSSRGKNTDPYAEEDDVIPSTLPGIRFEVAPWASVVDQFDKDGNNALSLDEVKVAFEKQAVAFFNAVDKNKDQSISRAEYMAYGQEMQSSEA